MMEFNRSFSSFHCHLEIAIFRSQRNRIIFFILCISCKIEVAMIYDDDTNRIANGIARITLAWILSYLIKLFAVTRLHWKSVVALSVINCMGNEIVRATFHCHLNHDNFVLFRNVQPKPIALGVTWLCITRKPIKYLYYFSRWKNLLARDSRCRLRPHEKLAIDIEQKYRNENGKYRYHFSHKLH